MENQTIKRKCNIHTARAAVAFCVKCGNALCNECVVIAAGRPHCPTCADIQKASIRRETLLQTADFSNWARKAQTTFAVPMHNKELRRIISFIIDAILISLFAIPVSLIFRVLSMQFLVSETGGLGFFLCLYASLLVTGTLYFILFTWLTGRTPGKVLMGLKVTAKNGQPMTLLASFWRWTGLLTALIWAFVGFSLAQWIFKLIAIIAFRASILILIALWFTSIATVIVFSTGILITFIGKHKRGFHDILGGSIVISELSVVRRGK
ncbi:MAG: RDD family protein [bacterium]